MTYQEPSSQTLILGAGPAGMAAAMELSKAGKKVTIIEKTAEVGGLAKTLEFREPEGIFRTDIGPHRFYSKNRYLYDFIEDLLGEQWIQVPRHTRFVVDGKFYHYPIRLGNVLTQIGLWKAFRIGFDHGWEKLRVLAFQRPQRSFEDYVISAFGRTLAEFNMLNYTEKIWGIPCSQISIDWATQRIGGLSILATLKKAIFGSSGAKSLVDTFYYPSLGAGLVYERIKERIERAGSVVHVSSEPVRIRWEGSRVTEVTVKTPHGQKTLSPSAVISSVPVTVALKLFDPPPPKEVLDAASGLRFRSQAYLFLTIDRERVTQDNWVYFPDASVPFGRISEMKNFSKDMCPPGKTSLLIEFFCFEGDAVWNATKEALFGRTMDSLEQMRLLRRGDVTGVHHFKIAHVYPLYDLGYTGRLKTILSWLDQLENFYAIGRPGRFRYTNQDHSLEMGILAAQSVLTGKRMNVDDVGAEKEYFERGYVPEKT